MSVVEKPPVPLQTQLLKVWAFTQNADGTFSPATSGGGGGTSNVNITGINGSAPALTNPLPIELSDGTNPFGTLANPLFVSDALLDACITNSLVQVQDPALESGLLVASGTSVIGTTGPTVMGKTTTAAPSYGTGTVQPLSLTTGGGLRADIASLLGVTAVAASAGILKVGVSGNAGASFDAPTTGTAPANVVYQGLRAATTYPTAATDGQIVASMADKAGRNVMVANAPRDLIGTAALHSASSSAVSFISAGSSGVFNDIISLIITNESSTATIVTLSDNGSGGNTYLFAIAANGGIVINFPTPLPQGTSAVAWDVLNSAAVALDYIAVYAKNK
jgi:hypothetical protein